MLELMIAKNIRHLRLKREMTQEELAERIGVTGQAVSRWERGECCPDITLLPGLANLFDVTTDKLLGMEELCDRKKLQDIGSQGSRLAGKKKYLEAATLYEQALKLFPDAYGLMTGAAQMLVLAEGEKQIRKAISLCECVLQNSTDEKLRGSTRASLCYMYRMAGAPEKAAGLARSTPHGRESRELLWPQFMEPAQREAYLKSDPNIASLLAQIQAMMDGKIMTDEEGIRLICVGE